MNDVALKRFIRISYCSMLTVLGALVCWKSEPVPITLQAFFAVLSGIVLGGSDGAVSQIVYLLLGMIGLPVFAFGGGYVYIFEPTFGYVVTLAFAAFISGKTLSRFKTINFPAMFVAGMSGLAFIYAIGGLYQFIAFMIMRGYSAVEASKTLALLPLSFAVQTVALLVASYIYPRAKTMIGSINREEFENNGIASPQPAK